ncbi:serine protein kinase RIO [Candidatus Woesearchaeota archaeon]|nr:serine protein kinase RIO [Candidatus Woesearchaeota archaeon]MBW3005676.1 serine protein kinase RIO [Candidatus Woesearchaeota archaeon]
MPKITREKFKTLKNVFDSFTERNLFKLISQGYFDGLESPIFIGKEANVFTALKGRKRVVVKIYRLQTCDFNRMYDYIKFDPRFPNVKKQRRKTVFAWAQREYRNLLKAREAGVRVPTPITCLYNILVMEYIGDEEPALKIKDDLPKNKKKFFDTVILGIRKLYKAGLVHADLSHFNILNYKEKPVFIDMSQATPLEDPNAITYLERDINNICNFFKKRGVKAESEEIKKKIMR